MKELYAIAVSNLAELEQAVRTMKHIALAQDEVSSPEVLYVSDANGDDIVLQLIENTLSDGSKTYDVRIS